MELKICEMLGGVGEKIYLCNVYTFFKRLKGEDYEKDRRTIYKLAD